MATVLFNKNIRAYVELCALELFNAELEAVDDKKPDESWGMFIYNTLMSDYLPLFSGVPVEFFRTVGAVSVRHDWNNGQYVYNAKLPSDVVMFASEEPVPSQYGTIQREGYYARAVVRINDDPIWDEFKADCEGYIIRAKEARAKRDRYVSAVNRLCDDCRTVNQALELWPPLHDMLSEQVKSLLNK